jgi:hypothetical protein
MSHLHRTGPRVVALSASLPTHLPTAHAAVTAVQATSVPVIVGGAAFGPDGEYARALGADGWARDAREAASILESGLRKPDPLAARQPVDDLPHLADQEYTLVVRGRVDLMTDTLADLEDRFPPVRTYSDRQRQHTAEDIGHIVDHLAAALYVDDAELFVRFIRWTADILTAREVPAHSLTLPLTFLTTRLRDFPRARHFLGLAQDAVPARPATANVPGPGKFR